MIGKAVAAHKDAVAQVKVITPIKFDVTAEPTHATRLLLNTDAVEFLLSDMRTLGPWDLAILGSQRVRLTGANGVGKSALMKLAAGLLSPTGGRIESNAGRAYLDQDLSVPVPGGRLIDNLMDAQPDMPDHDARAALAQFEFRNVMADRDVSGLSGGERLQLSLCMAMSGGRCPTYFCWINPQTIWTVMRLTFLKPLRMALREH